LWRAAIVPSVVNCIGQSCFAWSPYFIEPGLLTFMLRFQIIFVALGAFLLFPSERTILRSRAYWLGVAVVFAGSLGTCLLGPELPRGATVLGIVLAIAAGIFFGAYSLSVRYFMHNVHPVFAFAAISQYTAGGLVLIMLFVGEQHGSAVTAFTQLQWGMLAASALIGIALAHVMYYASIARLGVAVSAGVILLQPFFTGVSSYFIFTEILTPAQWICGLAAIGGAIVMLQKQQRLDH
jgi:drug/metabolite transporter (DMT)-like permease